MHDSIPGGPIDKFVEQTGQSHDDVFTKLKEDDVSATILFVADILHGDFLDLIERKDAEPTRSRGRVYE